MIDLYKDKLITFYATSPRVTCAILLGLGIFIGLITRPTFSKKRSSMSWPTGLVLTLPTATLADPAHDLMLRGRKVQFVRHDKDHETPCRLDHPAISFSANDRIMTFKAELLDMERFILAIRDDDLKRPKIADAAASTLPLCIQKTKVTYGEESL
jgi:hypothetical protein